MDILKIFLTSVSSVITLFIIAKFMGHKQLAQLDFFDYINGITIGSIAAEMATDLEAPWKPFFAMIIYGGVSIVLSLITNKVARARKFINGTPTIVMNDGKLYRKNMKKAKLDLSEFMVLCRQEGFFNLNEIQTAVFEHNGRLTILSKSNYRPLCADDFKISLKPELIFTEVIMDGRILEENLKRMGLDRVWLTRQLENQGYKSEKEIYLGICDSENTLSLFPTD
ncbi:MAG: DUF421 domain-containing protein [Clostridia bacterium]|nr:DUF421 domain-containing protein [Clostridia bacterium]MBO5315675.1 DUF421 domain-containing protein [Clostridia bacterium]